MNINFKTDFTWRDIAWRIALVAATVAIIVWFMQSFDVRLNLVENSGASIMALIAGLLVPVFTPLGLGDWRIITALISGFMAKESVVSTLQVLFGENGISNVLTTAGALTMLVFSLLYAPCVAAIASIRRELGRKWAVGVVLWQCVLAWIVALIVKLILTAAGIA